MTFELLPLIDQMIVFYQKPRGPARFREYLTMLMKADKSDLELPIVAYNPLGKEHVLKTLKTLKSLKAEDIARQTVQTLQQQMESENPARVFRLGLMVSDDLKGGWTNRFTADYGHKFRQSAMLKRGFCTPVFWTSEQVNQELIESRVQKAMWRTHYQALYAEPKTLEDHLEQERFVFQKINAPSEVRPGPDLLTALDIFRKNKRERGFPFIFSFFYGDKAARELGYTPLGGFPENAGFQFARNY